ncbi:MAG: FtsW/RodA/SpoVE family cell cycle protein [Lachnospiraceae bacterium]|nr:FtsW/RodA/SpoVE family cell cycle protein [Lachnospiraceae bacterium]
MALVISDLSKYVIVIFMAIYTLEAFLSFAIRSRGYLEGLYYRQIICMFIIHFVSFAAICLETSDLSYIVFYGFQQILLFAAIALNRAIYPNVNKLLLNNMSMLLAIGFVILTRLDYEKSIRQVTYAAISLVLCLFIPLAVNRFQDIIPRFGWVYGAVGIVMLAGVLLLGVATNGSKISYTILGYTFQPSEFVKILYVFFIAGMLYKSSNFKQVLLASLIAGLHVIILVVSRDLGSALILFIVYVAMIFIATNNHFYLIASLLAGAIGGIMASRYFSHVQVRIQAWRDPFSYIDGTGYQITQSLFAIGTGGWFGMGLYQGDPTAIPYVEDDFVFSAIAEEMGVLFSGLLVLLCLSCFICMIYVCLKLKHQFYRLVSAGLAVTYIFQIFLTIGGGTRLIPLTGVTLPLVSYGGSSVLTTLIMFSIVQGIYAIEAEEGERRIARRRKKLQRRREKEYFETEEGEEA